MRPSRRQREERRERMARMIKRTRPDGARFRRAGVSMNDRWFPLLIACGLAAAVVCAAALLMWWVR